MPRLRSFATSRRSWAQIRSSSSLRTTRGPGTCRSTKACRRSPRRRRTSAPRSRTSLRCDRASRVSARAWLAGPEEAWEVARLLIGFRDHYGRSDPPDDTFHSGVARLIDDPATDYLLATASSDGEPAGVCQLRYRHSLWTASEDCWLEDLYVAERARRAGLGEALLSCVIERARARDCL